MCGNGVRIGWENTVTKFKKTRAVFQQGMAECIVAGVGPMIRLAAECRAVNVPHQNIAAVA